MRNYKIIYKFSSSDDKQTILNDGTYQEAEEYLMPEENLQKTEQEEYNSVDEVKVCLRKTSENPTTDAFRTAGKVNNQFGKNIIIRKTQQATNSKLLMNPPNIINIEQPIETFNPLNNFVTAIKTDNSENFKENTEGNINHFESSNSKSVQTNYANNNICGVIDIWSFHLNCFFCTNKYHLKNWREFLYHLKAKHQHELYTFENDEQQRIQYNSEENSYSDKNEYQSDIQYNYKNDMDSQIIDSNSNFYESNKQLLIDDSQYYSNEQNEDDFRNTDPSKESIHIEPNLNTVDYWEFADNSETDETFVENNIVDYDDELPHAIVSSEMNLSKGKDTSWNAANIITEETTYDANHDEEIDYDADFQGNEEYIFDDQDIDGDYINNDDADLQDVNDGDVDANIEDVNDVDDDEMPSNDEDEDDVPKPTSGCGILFGLTNRQVVVDFLENLKKYPILYRSVAEDCTQRSYDSALAKLRFGLNDKYDLDLTDTEMRTSIKRVTDWYFRTLRKIRKHNHYNRNGGEPFHHRFAIYFQICQEFLIENFSTMHDFSIKNGVQLNPFNQNVKYPPWISFSAEDNADANAGKEAEIVAKQLTLRGSNQRKSPQSTSKPSGEISEEEKPKGFVCEICGKILSQKATLQTHKFFHTKPNYKCNLCDKVFFRKFWLDCHKNTQHGRAAVPYICEFCGKAIYSKGTFRLHKLAVHMNVRYTCVVCNYQTQSQRYLLRHQVKRHLALEGTLEELSQKLKPQGMRLIPTSPEYRDGYLWKLSIRKPGQRMFSCITCHLVFDRYKDVLHHNKQFHPVRHKSYMCVLCPPGKTLMRSSLRRHYTVVHKIPLVELEDWMSRTKRVNSTSEIKMPDNSAAEEEMNQNQDINNIFADIAMEEENRGRYEKEGIQRVEEETVFSDTEIMTTDDYIEIDNNDVIEDYSQDQMVDAQHLPENIDYEQILEHIHEHPDSRVITNSS